MKHIVLTTDLSDESVGAFGPVGELAAKLGARVTVLHVVPEQVAVPYGYPYVPPPTPEELTTYKRSVEKRLGEIAKLLPAAVRCECKTLESSGRVDQAICDFAHQHGVDAIAMSTHGHTGIRRFFLGSVAENVVRSAHLPVFLYPAPASKG